MTTRVGGVKGRGGRHGYPRGSCLPWDLRGRTGPPLLREMRIADLVGVGLRKFAFRGEQIIGPGHAAGPPPPPPPPAVLLFWAAPKKLLFTGNWASGGGVFVIRYMPTDISVFASGNLGAICYAGRQTACITAAKPGRDACVPPLLSARPRDRDRRVPGPGRNLRDWRHRYRHRFSGQWRWIHFFAAIPMMDLKVRASSDLHGFSTTLSKTPPLSSAMR